MELRDYPRPKNDTGIGVHWAPGLPRPLAWASIEQSLAARAATRWASSG